MCRQVLDGYLRDTAGVDQETIDWLRRLVTEPEGEERRLDEETERNLTSSLENVRVCDPAVGSGAFLLGAMQEIVQLRRGMLHARREYAEDEQQQVAAWKRRAIQWSLYGVDINPEAVEICQLRLWLSLVLDMWDPRTVDPLPNLDFRIVAADSLVDRVGDIVFAESLGGVGQPPMKPAAVEREERNIVQWRREFEATQDNPARLRELRDNINRAYHRIVRIQVEGALAQAREDTRTAEVRARAAGRAALNRGAERAQARLRQLEEALASTNADAPYQKPFLWPVAFKEVFDDGGFDVVLANPPYVRQERLSDIDQIIYASAFPDVHTGMADILVYFYARAVQILRPNGWLSFITSNSFLRRRYGQGLQRYLATALRVQSVIDFGETAIFEATVEPYVLVGKKGTAGDEHRLFAHNLYPVLARRTGRSSNVEQVREELTNLDGLLSEDVASLPQASFISSGWRAEDEEVLRLAERLLRRGAPLGQYGQGRVYYGIKTGLNEAFVVEQAKRDELLAADARSAQLIKPWLRGRDIRRWVPEWGETYLLWIPWNVEIDDFPALREHLLLYENALANRPEPRRGIHPWYALSRWAAEYHEELISPKIVWASISRKVRFAWDDGGRFINDKCVTWVEPPNWVLPVLNSRIAEFLFHFLTNTVPGGFMELKQAYLESFPIVTPDSQTMVELTALSREAVRTGDADQYRLEELVTRVYELADADRLLIDDWYARRSLPSAGSEEEEDDEEDH